MERGIIAVCVSPIRQEPSHRSEMISQALFGYVVQILNCTEEWCYVKNEIDQYEGWITQSHIQNSPVLLLQNLTWKVITEPWVKAQMCCENQKSTLFLTAGCRFPEIYGESGQLNLPFTDFSVEIDPHYVQDIHPFNIEQLVSYSKMFMNVPYLWGGKTIFGIDCSGLIQTLFSLFSVYLPRDAWQQAAVLQDITWEQRNTGDLIFFQKTVGKISHVALLMNKDFVIHASGRVRIDPITPEGIFNPEQKKYSHQNLILKTLKIT